jgi:GNAT superfamily N-acetyltransferase
MVKKFLVDDLRKCRELFIQVFNGEPWNDNWTNETANTYLQELTGHNRFLGYTLWDGNQLIGAVFAHMKHFKYDEIFIDELFISPVCQRKGYGIILMDAVETYAKENAIVSVTLLTGVGIPAFGFYGKLGYKHLDNMAFMYKRIE